MCARFEIIQSIFKLAERYSLSTVPKQPTVHKIEKRPTDEAFILTEHSTGVNLKWGFQMAWSEKPLINARAERLLEKPSFEQTHNNRCLVPASAWFEWRKDGSKKHKNRIGLHGVDIFTMAAIHDGESFCILTCAPANDIAHIHNRMPVLVPESLHDNWLNTTIPTKEFQPYLNAPNNLSYDIVEEIKEDAQLSLF